MESVVRSVSGGIVLSDRGGTIWKQHSVDGSILRGASVCGVDFSGISVYFIMESAVEVGLKASQAEESVSAAANGSSSSATG